MTLLRNLFCEDIQAMLLNSVFRSVFLEGNLWQVILGSAEINRINSRSDPRKPRPARPCDRARPRCQDAQALNARVLAILVVSLHGHSQIGARYVRLLAPALRYGALLLEREELPAVAAPQLVGVDLRQVVPAVAHAELDVQRCVALVNAPVCEDGHARHLHGLRELHVDVVRQHAVTLPERAAVVVEQFGEPKVALLRAHAVPPEPGDIHRVRVRVLGHETLLGRVDVVVEIHV